MTIAFFGNYLNHHQAPLADAFFQLLGKDYVFVQSERPNKDEMKGGDDYSSRPYYICAAENEVNYKRAMDIAREVDVALFDGLEVLPFQLERAQFAPHKLSFELGERWFKRGWINILSPRLLKMQWFYHTLICKTNTYKLCASAFAASDLYHLFSYRGKCYKWGYFTQVDENFDVEASLDVSTPASTTLMWCSRFLVWKHPELPVKMAAKLKAEGYDFVIDMYGDGEELEATKSLVERLNVGDVVKFKGNKPNAEILQAMKEHDIFLFTSDRHEGWGAVANEAMSNGCCIVGSDQIGSIPYLAKNGNNGMIFKSCDVTDLTTKVKYLLDNTTNCKRMAKQAVADMQNLWSPRNAAESLLRLIDDLNKGRSCSISEGPASIA